MKPRKHSLKIFGADRFVAIRVLILISLTYLNSCSTIQNPEDQTQKTNAKPNCESCDILFIGSSYLNYNGNDAIEIFSSFTTKAEKKVYIDRKDNGGWRLYDHAASQITADKINERAWDYIILQGNAAFLSQEKWHDNIIPYLKKLRKTIKENSAKTCIIYMMPWAYSDGLAWLPDESDTYEQMQENLYSNTIKVVHDIDIATAPVGWAWYTAISNGYDADLYISDHNHQSKSGALLTACVFFATIFEESAPLISSYWSDEDDPRYLHSLAFSMVVDSLSLWNIY